MGPGLGEKWWPPGGPMNTPQNYHHPCLSPCSEPQPLPASTGDPLIPAGRPGPGSCEVSVFSRGPGVHETCVCPPRVVFLFPPVLWNSCKQTLLPSKPDALEAPSPKATPPGWEPEVGLRTFTPMGEPLLCNYFPVCGLPTWRVWDLILSQLRPSYCLVVAVSLCWM